MEQSDPRRSRRTHDAAVVSPIRTPRRSSSATTGGCHRKRSTRSSPGSMPARRKAMTKTCPPLPKYAPGWTFGEPDMVIQMPVDFEVPAEGELPMQNFYVPVPFTEERWVEAVELRPGNPAVVHHSIANVVSCPKEPRSSTARPCAMQARAPHAATANRASETGGLSEGGWTRSLPEPGFVLHAPAHSSWSGRRRAKASSGTTRALPRRITAGHVFSIQHALPAERPRRERPLACSASGSQRSRSHHEVLTKGVTDTIFIGGKELSETSMVNGKEVKIRGRIPNIPPQRRQLGDQPAR